ncbi:MAG: L,D-transpeptidase family protein [Aquificaceae bacterium]
MPRLALFVILIFSTLRASELKNPQRVQALYSELGAICLWSCFGNPTELYSQYRTLLSILPQHGIDPEQFKAEANQELKITDNLLQIANALYYGQLNPATVFRGAKIPQKQDITMQTLVNLIRQRRLQDLPKELSPNNPEYEALSKWAERYISLLEEDWPKINQVKLQIGTKHPEVLKLRKRLYLLQDLPGESGGDIFDEELKRALMEFQKRHGLLPTGNLDQKTTMELNVTPRERLKTIFLNLEKLRWVSPPPRGMFVMVNVPSYELFLYEDGKVKLTSKVVVGRDFKGDTRPTPIIYSQLSYIVLNPKWYVPPSIASKDILPRAQRDPSIIQRKRLRIYKNGEEVDPSSIDWANIDPKRPPFMLVQDSGPGNSLGQIKFHFPNDFDVYLHDTPEKHLFNRHKRAYSSGCIRVEKARQLASELLGWNENRLNRAIASRQNISVSPQSKVPIYIAYLTAFERDGILNFREDIYGYDKKLLKALKEVDFARNISPGGYQTKSN